MYVRHTAGFLPAASVAFLDEIFTANAAVLNTLLTLMNERQIDDGNCRQDVPLRCLVGASNSPPAELRVSGGGELDALWDRFLLRVEVPRLPLAERAGLLGGGARQTSARIVATPAAQPPEVSADGVVLAGEARRLLLGLTDALRGGAPNGTWQQELAEAQQQQPQRTRRTDTGSGGGADPAPTVMSPSPRLLVSDRRLVRAARLLRVAAWSSGRRRVTATDCLLLPYVLAQPGPSADFAADWLAARLADRATLLADAQVSSKALSFCPAPTGILAKAVPFLAIHPVTPRRGCTRWSNGSGGR
eukprot:SAG22_NODE_3741_length_1549_cov_1.875172_2_plen_303_part_00